MLSAGEQCITVLTCNLPPRSRNNQIGTPCGDFCDAPITREDGYIVSTGPLLFFLFCGSGELMPISGPWERWPVLCSPDREKAFRFSSTKHSLMLSTEKTYGRHIPAVNHFTCALLLPRPHPVTLSSKNRRTRRLHKCRTPFYPGPKKTASALVLWFTNADMKPAKPELSACSVPC